MLEEEEEEEEAPPLVRRKLPQIVVPKLTSGFSLQTPADIGSPDPFELEGVQTASRFWYAFSLITALGFAGGVGSFTLRKLTEGRDLALQVPAVLNTYFFLGSAAAYIATAIKTSAILTNVWGIAAAALTFGGRFLGLVKDSVNQDYQNKLLVANGVLPLAQSLGHWIREISRRKRQESADKRAVYRQAVSEAKGIPLLKSLDAARGALNRIREQSRQEAEAVQTFGERCTMYIKETGERWQLSELYEVSDATMQRIDARIGEARIASSWNTQPNTGALTLLAPASTTEELYKAVTLRKTPFSEAIASTVGSTDGTSGTGAASAQLAAYVAHQELIENVRSRQRNAVGEGEQILEWAPYEALKLAKRASKLLEAAYGDKAGITLVTADDAYWACFYGGTEARLAVRHFSVFEQAQTRMASATSVSRRFEGLVQSWREWRRSLLTQFVEAWVQEAESVVRQLPKRSSGPRGLLSFSTRDQVVQALRAYTRIGMLTEQSSRMLVVVASKFHLVTEPIAEALILDFDLMMADRAIACRR